MTNRTKATSASLGRVCRRVYVVAHREDTSRLCGFLEESGFLVTVVRGPYTKEQSGFSHQLKCLVNHANAWKLAAAQTSTSMVVEADFVPVADFADLPCVFPVHADSNEPRFGWLYSAGSVLYGFDECGFPHGHGNTTVAYALTPGAAAVLLGFFEREMRLDDPGRYRLWETYLGIFLRKERGVLNYIPVYQYGEHGGRANTEHGAAGVRSWHQADVLWGRLAFLPDYAMGSEVRFAAYRVRSWARGVYRVLSMRFFDPRYVNNDSSRGRAFMAIFSIFRMLRLGHRL